MVTTKCVLDIANINYGEYGKSCEPSNSDIAAALISNDLESRGFQQHIDELKREWGTPTTCGQQFFDKVRQYHARRIAYFVKHGWKDPIAINSDGHTIKDGLHRLKAAKYLGYKEVYVTIE